jgi:hypothetical protein
MPKDTQRLDLYDAQARRAPRPSDVVIGDLEQDGSPWWFMPTLMPSPARSPSPMGHGWAKNPVASSGNGLQRLSYLRPTPGV